MAEADGKVLTVVVPSYNMEQYLPKCLGSLEVAPELMERLEVLVVNDGSKDRTSEIAHEFAAKWPGTFKVIDKENGHYGSCINAALKVATGVYIKVLDADDWFDTENFAKYLLFLLDKSVKCDLPDLVLNDYEQLNKNKTYLHSYAYATEPGFDISKFWVNGQELWMHAVAYRTDKVRVLNYEQLTGITNTDYQWIHLPMTMVERMAYFPGVVYNYLYSREGNSSSPAEYYRTYGVQVKVFRRLIEEYNRVKESIPELARAYLCNHLRFRVLRVYRVYLFERNPLLDQENLVDFDNHLKTNARWLYDMMNDVPFSTKLRFRYVRAWRKHQAMTPKWLLTMRFLKQVIEIGSGIARVCGYKMKWRSSMTE